MKEKAFNGDDEHRLARREFSSTIEPIRLCVQRCLEMRTEPFSTDSSMLIMKSLMFSVNQSISTRSCSD